MILLDTDHTTVLKFADSPRGMQLRQRLAALPDSEVVGVAIVTVEEQMRGWLASIARERRALRQPSAYRELGKLFEFFGEFAIAPFDDAAAAKFDELKSALPRLGAMDLKIAAIALANQASS
jgi:tRNA(fMet)-specific endonuclease VapC